MAMDIKTGRMVYLGYGKYWRSDDIVGLHPIEEGRGPGRRTEVYVSQRAEAFIASRSERAILQEMVTAPDEIFRMEEARSVVGDLIDALQDLSPLLRRVLSNEGQFEVEKWEERLRALLSPPVEEETKSQSDLFT
ncbi:MAG TPA: hypothetical protein VEH62_15320 [Gemmatimonadales bacterium]|nr:hypothetical protein [Gemmatimonadales bacterium]